MDSSPPSPPRSQARGHHQGPRRQEQWIFMTIESSSLIFCCLSGKRAPQPQVLSLFLRPRFGVAAPIKSQLSMAATATTRPPQQCRQHFSDPTSRRFRAGSAALADHLCSRGFRNCRAEPDVFEHFQRSCKPVVCNLVEQYQLRRESIGTHGQRDGDSQVNRYIFICACRGRAGSDDQSNRLAGPRLWRPPRVRLNGRVRESQAAPLRNTGEFQPACVHVLNCRLRRRRPDGSTAPASSGGNCVQRGGYGHGKRHRPQCENHRDCSMMSENSHSQPRTLCGWSPPLCQSSPITTWRERGTSAPRCPLHRKVFTILCL